MNKKWAPFSIWYFIIILEAFVSFLFKFPFSETNKHIFCLLTSPISSLPGLLWSSAGDRGDLLKILGLKVVRWNSHPYLDNFYFPFQVLLLKLKKKMSMSVSICKSIKLLFEHLHHIDDPQSTKPSNVQNETHIPQNLFLTVFLTQWVIPLPTQAPAPEIWSHFYFSNFHNLPN